MSSKFFTNRDNNTLENRLKDILTYHKNITHLEFLIGYFRISGFSKIATLIDQKVLQLKLQQLPAEELQRLVPNSPLNSPSQGIVFKGWKLDIKREIGQGSYGIVYKGIWHRVEHDMPQITNVAVKKLLTGMLSEATGKELKQEATIMENLDHPNIVKLFGYCVESNRYSLIMEYVPKGSLYGVLHSSENMNWKVRYDIALGVAKGIKYLHHHTPLIMHRDLKSPNILLDNNNQPKISDFGLARVKTETRTASRISQTRTAQAVGTAAWMAPELHIRGQSYTAACDIFSYGVIMWELRTRQIPWADAESEFQIPMWISQGQRETIPPNTPKVYATLLSRCWAQRAEARPKIAEVVTEIERTQMEAKI